MNTPLVSMIYSNKYGCLINVLIDLINILIDLGAIIYTNSNYERPVHQIKTKLTDNIR